ncbi:SDR family NAD(P)-dependent oxidoreductase [Streptomyces sp. NPDC056069]|uniref:SDR family NAD(P)-dependent oxidoreductase n=1 Tax=Streptomyces sp. NPDC056069 TaxID=3345702 RepID=UPI0035DF7465
MTPDEHAISAPNQWSGKGTVMHAIGQQVVVTGGTSGIGYDAARRLAESGAEVVITGQDPERLCAAAESIGAYPIRLALNDPGSVDHFFREMGSKQVDIFLANAGAPELNAEDQALQTAGAVDVIGRAAALVAPGGLLAVTNTLFTQFPREQVPEEFKAYVDGKRRLAEFIGSVAIAYPAIRVLDIALGFVDGTRGLARIKTPDEVAAYTNYMASITPGGKLTTSDEAAGFICGLVNREATGVRIGIDGSVISLTEIEQAG